MAQNNQIYRWIVRHALLTRAIVVSAVSLILILAIAVPFFKNASEINSRIGSKSKESEELANKVSILSGLDEEVLNERVKILDKALPPKKDVVLYLSTIEGLSNELQLNFGGISLAPGEVTEASLSGEKKATVASAVDEPGLHTLETEIDFSGSKENIYTFLRLIEGSAPLMQIKDVKISGLRAEDFSLSLKLGMLYAITDISEIKGQIALFDQKEESYFKVLSEYRSFNNLSDAPEDTGLGKVDLFEPLKLQQ